MPLVSAQRTVELARAEDPKQALIDAVDVSAIETLGENLLVATYIRPERTKGGIIRPPDNIKEDEYQGNVGLVVQVGSGFPEEEAKDMLHKWVIFAYTEGQKLHFDGVHLRIVSPDRIRAIVQNPNRVF